MQKWCAHFNYFHFFPWGVLPNTPSGSHRALCCLCGRMDRMVAWLEAGTIVLLFWKKGQVTVGLLGCVQLSDILWEVKWTHLQDTTEHMHPMLTSYSHRSEFSIFLNSTNCVCNSLCSFIFFIYIHEPLWEVVSYPLSQHKFSVAALLHWVCFCSVDDLKEAQPAFLWDENNIGTN